jgi:hypothetical protein
MNKKTNIKIKLFITSLLILINIFSCITFTQAAKNAIGVRIARNAEHLSPVEWYNKYAPSWFGNKGGGPAQMVLAGYSAVSVGTCSSGQGETIYVNAANVVLSDFYTNIYIISCPVGVDQDTIDIFEQILENWGFNANIVDGGEKQRLQRDTKRLADLNKIKDAIENYKENINDKNRYPDLLSGTYEQGKSISYWNSWQDTLAKELKTSLPTPPEDGSGWGPLVDLENWQSSVPWPKDLKNPDSVSISWNPDGCRVITVMKSGVVKTWIDDYGCNGSVCNTCQTLMKVY